MAKKQGTSYSPNTALIQGAGVAYRNYDNAPGMYSGLDKVIEAGTGMMEEAVEGFEVEQKRIEEEAKAAKAEKAKQDKDWFDLSGDVYANAGSFMKDVEYKDTAAKITALKKEYLAAQKSGSAEEMAAVQIKFNNIKSDIDDHKAFRETITDPEYGLSAAMDHSGVKDGSNGEDKAFMTGLIKEDYTITTEGGKKYYNVGGVKKTMAEIKEMAILKDNVPFATYHQTRKKYATAKSWNKEDAYFEVKNNIVPKTINGLKAFVADDGFGNGKNFTALLNDSKNKAAIKKEIDASLFDTDNSGTISDAEYDQFVLAVTDSRHKTWKQADGSYDEQAWQKHTSKIVTEQLVNGMGNAWTANQKPEGDGDQNPFGTPSKKDFNTKYGEWVSNAERNRRREFVENNQGFNGLGGSYEYNATNKTWTLDSGDGANPINMYDILKDEALLLPGDKRVGSKVGGAKKAQPLNMANEPVENGLLTNVFMMDDAKAIDQMKLVLPPNFTVRSGASKAGKFFGVDKVQIISDGGVDLGTFDVGYDDSEKALDESKRFNSNLQDYLIGEF